MRDNGLTAASFTALADVEAVRLEPVLIALREAGVAAYADEIPAATPDEDVDDGAAEARVRIFVDSTRIAAGRMAAAPLIPGLGAGLDPAAPTASRRQLSDDEVDASWSRLVAGLGPLAAPHPTAQPEEATPDEGTSDTLGSGLSDRLLRADQVPAGTGPRDYELVEESGDEGYVPPPPPPLPRPRHPVDRFAWAGAIGGPVLLVGSHALGGPGWIGGAGVLAFGAGFVTLIARMRADRDEGDDGAVL